MSDEELSKWGRCEDMSRQADIASVKAGLLTFEEMRHRADQRRRAVGLSADAAPTRNETIAHGDSHGK